MSVNLSELFPPSGGDGNAYDDTQIREDLAKETQDRIDGDQGLQDQIDALPDPYDDTQIRDDLAKETQDRIDGDAALQTQIDGLSGGGGGGAWTLVEKFTASAVSAFEVELPTDQYQKVRVVWHWKADPQNTMRTIAMRAKRGGSYISTKDQYRTQIAYTDSANGTWK